MAIDEGVVSAQQLQKRVLHVLSGLAAKIDPDVASKLADGLLRDVSALDRPPHVAQAMLACITNLCRASATVRCFCFELPP